MGIFEEMLKDIVDAWRMKDTAMTLRKIKKADKFYEKIERLRRKTFKPKEESKNAIKTRGEQEEN